jgi:hypothetical protein
MELVHQADQLGRFHAVEDHNTRIGRLRILVEAALDRLARRLDDMRAGADNRYAEAWDGANVYICEIFSLSVFMLRDITHPRPAYRRSVRPIAEADAHGLDTVPHRQQAPYVFVRNHDYRQSRLLS